MAVFPGGSTWIHLEPVGIWLDLVPVEPPGNSLPTGIQVENLESVPCLFGRYPTQKIPVGICLVPTGSGWNLWGTVKTSSQERSEVSLCPAFPYFGTRFHGTLARTLQSVCTMSSYEIYQHTVYQIK